MVGMQSEDNETKAEVVGKAENNKEQAKIRGRSKNRRWKIWKTKLAMSRTSKSNCRWN